MPDFKEWLSQQAAQRGNAAQRQVVEEWTGAVADLFAQIVRWLAEADPDQVLTITFGMVKKAEEGLGVYEAQTLRIALPARHVDLIPLARKVVGGVVRRGAPELQVEGRVDMTNGAEKYLLYRAVTPSGKKWLLVDDLEHIVRDLSKETFEVALQDLLS